MSSAKVAIVDDANLTKERKLLAALDQAGLWDALGKVREHSAKSLRILIKPDLGGFAVGSPTTTDPDLVELLIDTLHDHGHGDVAVASAVEKGGTWAENREAFALAELHGYHFVTKKGRRYDVIDLSSDVCDEVFPPHTALHGTGLSRSWANADVRIIFSKNKTDEFAKYALCLESLIGVLPLADKHLHYRTVRDAGDAVADLLSVAPVQFAIIDALISGHGAGGHRAPIPIETGTIIASNVIGLVDQIGAVKMGLDPFASPIFAKVLKRQPLPRGYQVQGSIGVYAGWRNVSEPLMRANRYRAESSDVEQFVEPWLQLLDGDLFPLKSTINTHINAYVAEFFRDTDSSQTSQWLLMIANVLLGVLGHALECYRVLYDKDSLRQRAVGLGLDPNRYQVSDFDEMVEELLHLQSFASAAPEASPGFRWRYFNEAVLFSYNRVLPIAFETFVTRVDVAQTIQFMNDYLGGVIVVLERDNIGRPIKQAERNIYLPQPNYMILYHGKPIDVTKIELVRYHADEHTLFWKTVHSENESATFDDGIAKFSKCADGTSITITGRQLFTLPPFWQAVDLNLVPDLKAALVKHAYLTFFDRTVANFEALVEGRNIRLGRGADEPRSLRLDDLIVLFQKVAGIGSLFTKSANEGLREGDLREVTDNEGFVHVRPQASPRPDIQPPSEWVQEVSRYFKGLSEAVQRDLRQRSSS